MKTLQRMQKRKINVGDLLSAITMVILAIVLLCGNVFAINTSKIVDVICIVTFPFLNASELMMITAFLIPVNSGITTLYIFGYIVALLIIKEQKFNTGAILSLFAIAGYELLLIAFHNKFELLKYVQYIEVLFLFIYGITSEKLQYKKICYSYIFGVLLLLLAVFVTASQTYGLQEVINGQVRIGQNEEFEIHKGTVALIQDNANNIGYYAVLASTMCILLAKESNLRGKTLLWISFVFIMSIASFTVSRTWLFLTVAGIALSVLLGYRGKSRVIAMITIAVIIAFGMSTFLTDSQIVQSFSDRLDVIGEDVRGEISLSYLNYLSENPHRIIFGTGAIYYREVVDLQPSLHFGFLQIFVSYGILGFVLWMWLLFSPVWKYYAENKLKFYKLIPLFVVLVFVQTIQFLNPFMLMLPYMIAVCYMKIPEEEKLLEAK